MNNLIREFDLMGYLFEKPGAAFPVTDFVLNKQKRCNNNEHLGKARAQSKYCRQNQIRKFVKMGAEIKSLSRDLDETVVRIKPPSQKMP